MRELFKKPWWVGPVAAGLAIGHPSATKPTGLSHVTGYQRIDNRGTLPRYGSVVVIATCPDHKHLIGGGYVLPSALATASSSRPEGNNVWRVVFKSHGGHGKVKVYAICAN